MVRDREPVRVRYRGRDVLTNPPPSAGGTLIAYALALLDADPGGPGLERLVEVMERAQSERTPEFLAGLDEPGFAARFLSSRGVGTGPLGSTTHIAVLDRDGWACSVTCSNGSCSGEVVPGTGIHLNNMLGEQDLNPLGFHRHPPGRRLPSMMAPTVVLREGSPQLVLGSAGSNRIRSAILQTIIRVVDEGMRAGPAVQAPRVHVEDGIVYVEPGIDTAVLEAAGRAATATCSSAASRRWSATPSWDYPAAATSAGAVRRSWLGPPAAALTSSPDGELLGAAFGRP